MRARDTFLDLISPGLARGRRENRPKPMLPPPPAPRQDALAVPHLARTAR